MATIFLCKASQLLCALAGDLQLRHVFRGRVQRVFVGATTDTAGVTAPLLGNSPSTSQSWTLHQVVLTAYTTPLCAAPSAA